LRNNCSNHSAYRYYYNITKYNISSNAEDFLVVYKNKYCAKCHGINQS
jgi:hypothetical protein